MQVCLMKLKSCYNGQVKEFYQKPDEKDQHDLAGLLDEAEELLQRACNAQDNN
jgi:hypothetical protein